MDMLIHDTKIEATLTKFMTMDKDDERGECVTGLLAYTASNSALRPTSQIYPNI
jgi:hypothetical protein